MNNSILNDVKKVIGIGTECTDFDTDIIIHINSVISTFRQMGIGPKEGYSITGPDATWADYLGDDLKLLHEIKSCMALKVKKLFDPPANGTLIEAIDKQIAEFEWRMYVEKGGY